MKQIFTNTRSKLTHSWVFLILGLVSLPAIIRAQTYSQDLDRIIRSYKQGAISFKMIYRYYPNEASHKVSDSMSAVCSMDKDESFYKIIAGGKVYEYVKNDAHYFVVDHSQHVIAVSNTGNSVPQAWDITRIDSLAHAKFSKVTYQDVGKNQGEYDVWLTEGNWNHFRLVFNKSTYTLVKVFMYCPLNGKIFGESYSKPVVSISYTDYRDKVTDRSCFSEDRFFRIIDSNIIPTAEYKAYKVLNYLKKV